MTTATFDANWYIPVGTEVYTADGVFVGAVMDANPYELVVQRGFLIVHDYEVPLSAFDRMEDGQLILTLTMEDVTAKYENS